MTKKTGTKTSSSEDQQEKLREQLVRAAGEHHIDPRQLEAIIEHERYHAAAPSLDLSKHVKKGKVTIGALDSTRLNSRFMRPDIYRSLYERFRQFKVSYVLHCGDMTDGYLRYPTHVDDIIFQNYEEMLERLFDPDEPFGYPSIGVPTYFIGGNIDKSFMKRRMESGERTNVCEDITDRREDLVFLGWNGATIRIAPETTVRLSHPLPGLGSKKPYAISYPLQLRVAAFGAGQKPDILMSGFFQQRYHFTWRGIEAQLIPSCISQTPIELERNIPAPALGGVIFEVYFDKQGGLKELVSIDLPFYG
ncbi:hypothetical protein HY490_02800 [Candidatus Woesearchaeota archaeon]|nr:hypothetical protein [Candidatus Woesearchaeota archaeon]